MSQTPVPVRKKSKRGVARLLDPAPSGRMAGDKIQRGVLVVVVTLLVLMIVAAVLLGFATHDSGAGVTSFVLFAAAAAVGAGLGFLFGLPRARVAGDETDPATTTPTASTFYLTNSNLIKVSDWLTTIVIGLGLVNLDKVVPAIRRLGHALHQPLGGAPYSGAVGISVLIVGLFAGFILDYLWTSIRVRELLEESEQQVEHVPELRHGTIADAQKEMAGTGLKLSVPPGLPSDTPVAEQTVPPGTAVPPGTRVAVIPTTSSAGDIDSTQILRSPDA
jgi:PASTA domain